MREDGKGQGRADMRRPQNMKVGEYGGRQECLGYRLSLLRIYAWKTSQEGLSLALLHI